MSLKTFQVLLLILQNHSALDMMNHLRYGILFVCSKICLLGINNMLMLGVLGIEVVQSPKLPDTMCVMLEQVDLWDACRAHLLKHFLVLIKFIKKLGCTPESLVRLHWQRDEHKPFQETVNRSNTCSTFHAFAEPHNAQ